MTKEERRIYLREWRERKKRENPEEYQRKRREARVRHYWNMKEGNREKYLEKLEKNRIQGRKYRRENREEYNRKQRERRLSQRKSPICGLCPLALKEHPRCDRCTMLFHNNALNHTC